jgi:4-hydroxybenzoate polyprenyltransferase
VCLASFVLSVQLLSFRGAVGTTLAIFFGQCIIGWTNDLVDLKSDRIARRLKKPLVAEEIDPKLLRTMLPIVLILTIFTSLLSPLQVKGTLLHVAGLSSATLYNIWLKRTPLSFAPYVVSFALLPIAIYSTVSRSAPVWLVAAFATVACSFHFLNVIKDIDEDLRQGLLGLPQRVGKKLSRVIAFGLLLLATAEIMFLR